LYLPILFKYHKNVVGQTLFFGEYALIVAAFGKLMNKPTFAEILEIRLELKDY